MKATGIVRRIEARVIITQNAIKPYKHWGFGQFLKKNFEEKQPVLTYTYQLFRRRIISLCCFFNDLNSLGDIPL
jgi:hypothetical protein